VELPDKPRLKPFGVAIDPQGRAWVTANKAGWIDEQQVPQPAAGRVFRVSRDGSVELLPDTNGTPGAALLSWPMGIAGDSKGNMWVSNSNSVNVPCVTPLDPQRGPNGPSVVLYPADDGEPRRYTGGGLTVPWGNAIDGNDTLWVFNFGHHPLDAVDADTEWPNTGISHFCGVDEHRCPPGMHQGEAISPKEGYVSDALDRITGGGVDPSGNLWLMNNWKKDGLYGPVYNTNPGGNSFVIVPGAAAPLKTPLIGPPRVYNQAGNQT
jgi:sugar lactone lactonase YvrE